MISDRIAVKDALVSAVAAKMAATTGLETVGVDFGHPGEQITNDAVWFGDITGNVEADTFGSPGNTDEFSIECVISAISATPTEYAACQRAQLILSALNVALFRTSPRPGASLSAAVYPGKQDGPNGYGATQESPASAEVVLSIVCRVAVRGA